MRLDNFIPQFILSYLSHRVKTKTVHCEMQKAPENSGADYVVQYGDTLSGLANQNNTNLAELLKNNPQIKNPDLIYPGQVINFTYTITI